MLQLYTVARWVPTRMSRMVLSLWSLPIFFFVDATVGTWVGSGTFLVAPLKIVIHTMTYRMIIANHGTVAKIEIAEAEHDEARWLSLDETFKLPLVWHVRRTLEVEQNQGIK